MTHSEILNTMKLLGIKEITSRRQALNGTRKFKLPMKYYSEYDSRWNYDIVLSSFKSGYVRKTCYDREYQINKVKKTSKYHKYNTKGFENPQTAYYKIDHLERILIPNELDRLEYLLKFAVRNYYIKPVIKTKTEEKRVLQDISVTIDGQRHTLQSAEGLDFSKLEADRFYEENKDKF